MRFSGLILASVDLSNELREKILQKGFYVDRIHDQVFELDIPDNLQPQAYESFWS